MSKYAIIKNQRVTNIIKVAPEDINLFVKEGETEIQISEDKSQYTIGDYYLTSSNTFIKDHDIISSQGPNFTGSLEHHLTFNRNISEITTDDIVPKEAVAMIDNLTSTPSGAIMNLNWDSLGNDNISEINFYLAANTITDDYGLTVGGGNDVFLFNVFRKEG